jgi:hypothetical protein
MSHDRRNIFAKSARRPPGASTPRLPVSGQIETDNRVARGRRGDLGVPIRFIAAPAVPEDERGLATFRPIEVYRNAVMRDDCPRLFGHCEIIAAVGTQT